MFIAYHLGDTLDLAQLKLTISSFVQCPVAVFLYFSLRTYMFGVQQMQYLQNVPL